jgi:hypothetical protein
MCLLAARSAVTSKRGWRRSPSERAPPATQSLLTLRTRFSRSDARTRRSVSYAPSYRGRQRPPAARLAHSPRSSIIAGFPVRAADFCFSFLRDAPWRASYATLLIIGMGAILSGRGRRLR